MPQDEAWIHVAFEAAAVFVMAPILLVAGITHQNVIIGLILIAAFIITVLVDGYLLLKSGEWSKESGCNSKLQRSQKFMRTRGEL